MSYPCSGYLTRSKSLKSSSSLVPSAPPTFSLTIWHGTGGEQGESGKPKRKETFDVSAEKAQDSPQTYTYDF